VLPATPASAADAPSTPLYLHSAKDGYLADHNDDPGAAAGLRAPRGSTADTTAPTDTTDATAVMVNGTVPGTATTPTFSLPPKLAGTVRGVCLDLWLSKTGGTTPAQLDIVLNFKGPGTGQIWGADALSVYYTPGTLAHVRGYVSNPVLGPFQMAAGTSVYLSTYVDGGQVVTMKYDSADHPSHITLNADPATCPTPPAPPPAPRRLVGEEQPRYATYPVPATLRETAKQPSLGVDWSTGTTIVQSGTRPLRVEGFDSAGGPVWEPATPATSGPATLNPFLLTSRRTRRTYASSLSSGCGPLAVSDDSARHWLENPAGCALAAPRDRMIGAGPYAAPVPAAATFPEAVWYCGQSNAVLGCAQSTDGGVTFGAARPAATATECADLTPGRPAVAPDGTVYVPLRDCSKQQAVAVSEDNGATWAVRPIPESVASTESMPSVAVAADGTVYAAFSRADGAGGKAFAAVSRNEGRTWTWLRDVGADGTVLNAQFPAVVAGDADRAAVAFVGTPVNGNDQESEFGGEWHLYVATTVTGGHDWTTVRVTPDDDPVQRGCILTSSTAAGLANTCGNLGAYISATVDREGRVLVAYADGCIERCVEVYDPSTAAALTLARQEGGIRLFEAAQPSVPDVVRPTATSGDGVIRLAWDAPGSNGRPISGYTVYRGLTPNPTTVIAELSSTARSFDDTTATRPFTYYYTVAASNTVGRGQHYVEAVGTAYVPGPVDADRSEASAFPGAVPANGAAQSAVTVVLRDATANPVSGKQVRLVQEAGPAGPVVSPATVTTNQDGRAVFAVKSSVAGHVVYRAEDTTDGVVVTQRAEVDFLAGAVDATKSTLTATPGSVVADGVAQSTVTAVLRDANNNPVPGQLVELTHSAGPGAPSISPPAVRTDGNGRAQFAVRSTTAGTDEFTATNTTEGTVVAQRASVTFVAGPADAADSTLTVDQATLPSDGASLATFTVTLVDAQGNAASGRSVTLGKVAGPGSPVISPASATTGANGVATFTARSTYAGQMTFAATSATDGVTVAQTAQVTFQVGAVSASASGVTASPSSVVADGSSAGTVTVTLRDVNGNGVAGKTVTLAKATGPGTPAIAPSSAVTDGNGQAAFTVTSTVAGATTYRATDTTDGITVTQTATVTFRPGPVSASVSSFTTNAASVPADGSTTATLVATLRDANGNAVSGKTVSVAKSAGPGTPTVSAAVVTDAAGQASFTVRSTTAGLVTFRATDTTDGVVVTQTADVTFQVGPVSAAASGLSASASSVAADGTTVTLTATLRDAQGNVVAGKSVTLAKSAGPGSPVITPASVTTDAAGQAAFTVSSTTAGTMTFRATDATDGVVVTQTADVTFQPGAVSASASGLVATPGTVAADGVAASTLVATLRDAHGNAVSGKTVTLAKTAGPGSPTVSPASAVTNAAGQASFTVKSTTAGTATFRATDTTDSVVVTQTADVTFAVGAVDAATSGLTAAPASVVADGATASTLTATLRDAQGNAVSGKSVTLAKVTGPGTPAISPASVMTNASGQAVFTVTATYAGSYTFRATDTTDNVVVTQTAAVSFTAGPAAASMSSVTSSGNVPNDGTTAATVTVVLRDANANPAPGRTVTLAKSAGTASPSITPASRVTDSTGTATFSVTATTAGTATFRATSTTDSVVVTQTADVTFVPPPDTPTGLTATPGNAQVTLAWTPAAGGTAPTAYRVYQNGSLAKTVAAPASGTTVTGLTDGTTYSFQVSAYSSSYRESALTGSVSATPRPAPNAPTGLTATPGDGVVNLSWSAPSSGTAPTEYRVWENGALVATVGTTSAQRTGRTNGQAYSYEVQAFATNYGASAKTATVSATPVGPPAAPASVAAAPGDGDVVLTWTAPASTAANPVTGQRVYVDGAATPAATLGATETTYRATGFTNFTGHTFVVASYNGTAETRAAAVAATPTAPPTALTVGAVGSDSVALSWTAPSGSPTGYRVYLDGVLRTTVATTSTTLTGLAGATSYSITVSAVNSATPVAESAKTAPATVLTKPGTPTGLTVTAGNRELGVAWTAPAGGAPTGYHVYLDGTLAATVTTGTATTLASLVNGQAYAVTVSAYNATGDSATAAGNGTPTLPAPAYYSLSDTSTGTGADVKVTYAFEPVPNASGYRLYRNGVEVSSTFRTYLSTRRAMDDTARSFTTSYQYTVAAVDGSHVGPQSPVRTIVTRPDSVPATVSVQYLCGSVANTYRLKFTWSAPAKGTWTGFRALNADGTLSGNVGSTIRTYTTGNQPEDPSGTGGFYWYGYLYTVNTPSTNEQSAGHFLQGQSTTNC
jgi:hypothetical protein